jgi:hypothetical protein
MLNITCTTLTCLQMYLGSGTITSQADNGFLYRSHDRTYFCKGRSGIYACQDLDEPPPLHPSPLPQGW